MTDPILGGINSLSQSLNATQKATKNLTKSIENIQQESVDVANRKAQERIRERREAEFRKEQALTKALQEWQRKRYISDEEAKLKIDFVKKYGAKEWEAVLKIKLDKIGRAHV